MNTHESASTGSRARDLVPFAVVIALSAILLVSSLRSAVELQHSEKNLDLLVLQERVQEGVGRVLGPLVLAAAMIGMALWIVCAVKKLRRGWVLPSEWQHEPMWAASDVLVVSLIWGGVTVSLLLLLSSESRQPERPEAWAIGFALRAVMAAAVLWMVKVRQRGSLAVLGLQPSRFSRNIALGFLAFLCFLPFYIAIAVAEGAILQHFHLKADPQESVRIMLTAKSLTPLVALPVMAVVIAPFVEELYFRGFLQGMLRRRCGSRLAIVAAAALFATTHVNLFLLPSLFVLGLMLGYLYDRTQSLAAPLTLHVCLNASTLIVLGLVRLA